jgi:hypothetical protein
MATDPTNSQITDPFAVGLKGAFGVEAALPIDPPVELVAIDREGQRDAGVTWRRTNCSSIPNPNSQDAVVWSTRRTSKGWAKSMLTLTSRSR